MKDVQLISGAIRPEWMTIRQHEVLQQICCGKSVGEIADGLFIAIATVRNHTDALLRGSETSSVRELAILASNNNWVDFTKLEISFRRDPELRDIHRTVIELLVKGLSLKDIAAQIYKALSTVRNYLELIYFEYGVSGQLGVVCVLSYKGGQR